MAIGIHIVRTAFKGVNRVTGAVVDKESPTTSIGDVMQTEHRHVVLTDTTIPNSANHPTVDQYLKLEAQSNYILYHIDQTTIITYDQSAINNA